MNKFNVDIRIVFGVLLCLFLSIHLFSTAISTITWLNKHNAYKQIESDYLELLFDSRDMELIEFTKSQIKYVKSSATREKNKIIEDAKTVGFSFLIMVIVYLMMIVSFSFVRSGDVVEVKVRDRDGDKT